MSSAGEGGIGVLGSAFNPPHLGHLALAQEALWQLGLREVVLVPTGEAPHKRIADDPGRELRMTMTRLAAAGAVAAVVVDVEPHHLLGFLRPQRAPDLLGVAGVE